MKYNSSSWDRECTSVIGIVEEYVFGIIVFIVYLSPTSEKQVLTNI